MSDKNPNKRNTKKNADTSTSKNANTSISENANTSISKNANTSKSKNENIGSAEPSSKITTIMKSTPIKKMRKPRKSLASVGCHSEFNSYQKSKTMFTSGMDFETFQESIRDTVRNNLKQTKKYDGDDVGLEKSVELSIIRQWDFYVKRTYIQYNIFNKNFDQKQKLNHIKWCYLCVTSQNQSQNILKQCTRCCLSFHVDCAEMNSPLQEYQKIHAENTLELISMQKSVGYCNICIFNKELGARDIVWYKMRSYSWWPARILSFHEKPSCLGVLPSIEHCPIKFYGTNNYAWGHIRQMFSFEIDHKFLLNKNNKVFNEALKLAIADFIEYKC